MANRLLDILMGAAQGYSTGTQSEIPEAGLASGFAQGVSTAHSLADRRKKEAQELRRKQIVQQIISAPPEQRALIARNSLVDLDPELAIKDELNRAAEFEKTARTREEENRRRVEDFANKEKLLKMALDAKTKMQTVKKKPIPASVAEKTAQIDVLGGLLDEVKKDFDASYTGPFQGRLGQAAQVSGLGATEQRGRFRQNLASIRNQILQLRSGAAITPQEASRLLQELPDPNRSDVDFSVAMTNFENSLQRIQEARRRAFREAGYNIGEEENTATPDDKNEFSDIAHLLE